MTNADKLFEKAGYKKTETEYAVTYTYTSSIKELQESFFIVFNKLSLTLEAYLVYKGNEHPRIIFPNEIVAVYEKSKELGWF